MSKSQSFSIGMLSPKYEEYLDVMFRMARVFGARSIFTINNQWSSYNTPDSSKRRAEHYPPYDYYHDFAGFTENHLAIFSSDLVIVETRLISDEAKTLEQFQHPEKATYLFIGRDSQWPKEVLKSAQYRLKR